jgi:hypothetical protein
VQCRGTVIIFTTHRGTTTAHNFCKRCWPRVDQGQYIQQERNVKEQLAGADAHVEVEHPPAGEDHQLQLQVEVAEEVDEAQGADSTGQYHRGTGGEDFHANEEVGALEDQQHQNQQQRIEYEGEEVDEDSGADYFDVHEEPGAFEEQQQGVEVQAVNSPCHPLRRFRKYLMLNAEQLRTIPPIITTQHRMHPRVDSRSCLQESWNSQLFQAN